MKILIITVAGMAERFSRSVGRPCIKCLYSNGDAAGSLIYRLTHLCDFDKYIIVGGFKYDELYERIRCDLADIWDRIIMVNNKNYSHYGSGYSLYMGLSEALKYDFSELVFAEGDLYFDKASFEKLCNADVDVITTNSEPIEASHSVAFYTDINGKIHYIFDTSHNYLEIPEPFININNSGQVWKFCSKKLVNSVFNSIPIQQHTGTNLVFVNKYFDLTDNFRLIRFNRWVNCNTVEDFNKIGE